MDDNSKPVSMKNNTDPGGWRKHPEVPTMPEVYSSVPVSSSAGFWRKLLAFTGPGLMVAVGYMDPGNWATDLAGGARFVYSLITVILISNLVAILLRHLALKLGIVSDRDLAQACSDHYSRPVALCLWVLSEIAIAATDLAEVIGSAVALNLLFGIPVVVGVVMTAMDVTLVLFLQNKGFRHIEALIGGLIFVIGICLAYQLLISQPQISSILGGIIPGHEIIVNPGMLYIAIGILGTTVMPHNLYLHTSIVQTRAFKRDDNGRRMAIRQFRLAKNSFLDGDNFDYCSKCLSAGPDTC